MVIQGHGWFRKGSKLSGKGKNTGSKCLCIYPDDPIESPPLSRFSVLCQRSHHSGSGSAGSLLPVTVLLFVSHLSVHDRRALAEPLWPGSLGSKGTQCEEKHWSGLVNAGGQLLNFNRPVKAWVRSRLLCPELADQPFLQSSTGSLSSFPAQKWTPWSI